MKQNAKQGRHIALGVALLVHIECGWIICWVHPSERLIPGTKESGQENHYYQTALV
jgi:hypothetical protein